MGHLLICSNAKIRVRSFTNMMKRFLWQRKLSRIPHQEWLEASAVTPDGRVRPSDKLWWTASHDHQYFHESPQGRFSLGRSIRICYLASDISITLTETNVALRLDDRLTFNTIGNFVPQTPRRLSPSLRLNVDTTLLDLRTRDDRFLISLPVSARRPTLLLPLLIVWFFSLIKSLLRRMSNKLYCGLTSRSTGRDVSVTRLAKLKSTASRASHCASEFYR
jgi:hypothetical protein